MDELPFGKEMGVDHWENILCVVSLWDSSSPVKLQKVAVVTNLKQSQLLSVQGMQNAMPTKSRMNSGPQSR